MYKKKHVNHLSTHANHIHKDNNKFNNHKHRLKTYANHIHKKIRFNLNIIFNLKR